MKTNRLIWKFYEEYSTYKHLHGAMEILEGS